MEGHLCVSEILNLKSV